MENLARQNDHNCLSEKMHLNNTSSKNSHPHLEFAFQQEINNYGYVLCEITWCAPQFTSNQSFHKLDRF